MVLVVSTDGNVMFGEARGGGHATPTSEGGAQISPSMKLMEPSEALELGELDAG